MPPDITIDCSESTEPSSTGEATGFDLCDLNITIVANDSVTPGSCAQESTISRAWTASDNCGNYTSATQTITITDTIAPTLTCPGDLTLECDESTHPNDIGYASGADNCNTPSVTWTDSINSGSCPGNSSITRLWIATDNCGNSTTCLQFIQVQDSQAPTISSPPNVTISCEESTDPLSTGMATVVDNCDAAPNLTFTDDTFPGPCPYTFSIVRIWSSTDSCGNTAVAGQFIDVMDTAAPDLACPPDVTIECNDSTEPSNTGEATALDNCDTSVSVTYFDTPVGNTIEREWSTTDICNNTTNCTQIITILDTQPPAITCPPDLTLTCVDSTDPGFTGVANAFDNCDPIVSISYTDAISTGTCGQNQLITRTWTATDDDGNIADCDQVLDIQDTIPPVITCPPTITLSCNDSTDPNDTGFASAMDDCSINSTITYADSLTPGTCTDSASIDRTWTAIDDCGNQSTCMQQLLILDTVTPVITVPVDLTLSCEEPTDPSMTGEATAIDDCDDAPTVSYLDAILLGSCSHSYIISRNWKALDNCGNFTTDTQLIIVEDTTAPVISCPVDLSLDCDDSTNPNDTGFATATDLCDTNVVVTYSDFNNGGTIERSWTAIDECGNESTCTQTLEIDDMTPPAISCPSDITLSCTTAPSPGNAGTAVATDNCDPNPVTTFSDSIAMGSCPQETFITRTWTASDVNGNSSVCTQLISQVDNSPPLIACPIDLTISCDASTDPLATGNAMAIDNCDTAPGVTYSDSITFGGSCAQEFTITRVWSATDACGNTTDCTQIINGNDFTPPALTIPADTTVDCGESTDPANTGTASAVDNCGATPTVTWSDASSAGTCNGSTVIVRTWTASDECGNVVSLDQTITEQDISDPFISCPTNVTINCDDSLNPTNTGFAVSTDACDPAPSVNYSDSSNGGIVTRTWIATDDCGNTNSCDQIITVIDPIAPVITCPSDITQECDTSTDPLTTGDATATDNCDPSPDITYADTVDSGTCTGEAIISRTWTAQDSVGNTTTCTQLIHQVDSTAPMLSCPTAITIECDEPTEPTNTGTPIATDGCDNAPTITFSDSFTNGTCAQSKTISRFWSSTDACGNTSACTQTITVQDTIAPLLTLPPDVTLECGDATDTGSTGLATATDNCSTNLTLTFTDSATLGSCGGEETIARIWIATDECSNSIQSTQQIVIVDTGAPTISCPPDLTIQCSDSTAPAVTGFATATDICDPTPGVTFSDTISGDVIMREWTAQDACSNTITCTQSISLEDTTPPTITCPTSVTLACGADTDPSNTGTAMSMDNCDPAPAITYTDTVSPGACPQGQSIVRVWKATDEAGNFAECTQVIVLQDTGAPSISCPTDLTLECDASTDPVDTGSPSTLDNCDPSPTVSFVDTVTTGSCTGSSTIARAWSSTDACGNSMTCQQTITLIDTMAPTITVPANLTLECDASTNPTETGSATGTDNCVTPTAAYSDNTSPGSCTGEAVITRTWTMTDSCGNSSTDVQFITQVDTTAPSIACPVDITIECSDSTNPIDTGEATVVDNCDGSIAATFTDMQTGEIITRTWSVTDSCGNSSSCEQTISLVDTTAPVITCPIDVSINCDDSTDPLDTGSASATDNCDITITITYIDNETTGTCAGASVIARTWTATDADSNSSSCVQTLTISDQTVPIISCPGDLSINCNQTPDPSLTGSATATDNCATNIAISYSDNSVAGTCPGEFFVTRTWTADDECGNQSSCQQLIYILDQTFPVLNVPSDLTIECTDSTDPVSTGIATATDNCDPSPVVTFSDTTSPGSCSGNSTIQRQWSAVDACGHPVSTIQTITIQDSTPPIMACPVDIIIECDDSTDPSFTGSPTATDNCDPTVSFTFSDNVLGFGIIRIWGASDGCGNNAVCAQIITIDDTTAPVVSCPADATLECTDSTDPVDTGSATATDNCDPSPSMTYYDTAIAGSCAQQKTIIRTWQSLDNAGNSGTCVQNLVIQDTTAPAITCPVGVTISCTDSTEPAGTGSASAVDSCDPAPSITFADTFVTGSCPQNQTVTRTWTATDDCGNSSICIQTLVLEDLTAPILDVPSNLEMDCNANTSPTLTGEATAIDSCDSSPVITFTDSSTVGGCPNTTIITRIWTASDACGNTTIGTQTISLTDYDAPVLSVPADVTIECDGNTSPALTGAASATDVCDPSPSTVFFDNITTGSCSQASIITRTWSTMDACGNIAQDTQLITMIDTTLPVISCPLDISIQCDDSSDPSNTGSATATDNCDSAPAIAFSDTQITGGIQRIWIAADGCGNQDQCTQIILVNDTVPPTITCPGNVTIECDNDTNPTATGSAIGSDNCDPDPSITYTDSTTAGTCGEATTITRIWTISDNAANSVVCTQLIELVDTTAPVVTCPAHVTIDCDGDTAPTATGEPTATDNCDTAVTFTYADNTTAGSCDGESLLKRTWTAMDSCGNQSSCDQFITLTDIQNPSLTLPADTTIECDASTAPAQTGIATATDTCDPGPNVTYADTFSAGTCPGEQILVRSWTATDACGNFISGDQTISLQDTTSPSITPPADVTLSCTDSTSPSSNALTTDTCDANPSVTYIDNQTVGSCAGASTITRSWTSTDACGNNASATQTISIVDTSAPTVTAPTDITISCTASTDPSQTGIGSATDDCDPAPLVTYSDTATLGTCAGSSTITRSWSGTDACGNTSSVVQTITVIDATPPALTTPPTIFIECDDSTAPLTTGNANATDSCDPSPVVTFTDTITAGSCDHTTTILRIWTADDACGNRSSGIQIIFIADTTSPSLTTPANVTIECNTSTDPSATGGSASATDNCDVNPAVTYSDTIVAGSCAASSTIQREWTATDNCGNISTETQTITITDTTAPTISCPSNISLECSDSTEPATTGFATGSDNCDASPSITFGDSVSSNILQRTWTATDACGNSTFCIQEIPVNDTTPPTITCPVDATLECTDSTAPLNTGEPTANDNCDSTPLLTFSDAGSSGSCASEEIITRTWIASDNAGNTANCNQVLTIFDTTAPVVTCPADVTITCTDATDTATLGVASATDLCDPSPSITYSSSVTAGSCAGASTITRTWIATDACGNDVSCNQTISIVDIAAPTLSLPADLTLECTESTAPATTGTASATDDCDPTPGITYTDTDVTGSCTQEKTITRTWLVADACGNQAQGDQTISIQDTISPTITCPADITLECDASSDPSVTGSATTTDNCDATPSITFSDSSMGGMIMRTWSAADACGNSTSCLQHITVNDTTAPVISCPASVNLNCDASTDPADTGSATATDNCDPDIQITFSDISASGSCPGDVFIYRTWSAMDNGGNEDMCLQLLTLTDTAAPTIFCPADLTLSCADSTDPGQTGTATSSDLCDVSPSVTYTDSETTGSCTGARTITRTWTATDTCGNAISCDQTLSLEDILAPSLLVPSDVTIECDVSTAPTNTGIGTGSDLCDPAPQVTYTDSSTIGTCGAATTITRTWSIQDDCGNSASAIQTITVEDTTAPNLSVPASITISCADSTAPGTTGVATATDNCTASTAITYSDTPVSTAPYDPDHILLRTWIATDACGNSSTSDQIISIHSVGDLQISLVPRGVVFENGQWRLLQGPDQSWHDSGDTLHDLPVGSYEVEFSDAYGFITPDIQTITITCLNETERTFRYAIPNMLLIPGGVYQMGENGGGGHEVTLSDFLIDAKEVTVNEYQAFCDDTGRSLPLQPWGDSTLPVVNISWSNATAYATWAGKRMPTEAEWEFASRGGLVDNLYPWGTFIDDQMANYDLNELRPTEPGHYTANGYGLFDIGGNVWEWAGDWYTNMLSGPVTDPTGPAAGKLRVVRGGSLASVNTHLRNYQRNAKEPTSTFGDLGFRCAKSVNYLADDDTDGLPDWWEYLHFGDLTISNGNSDSDGDGMNDREEYASGSHPLQANSYLHITDIHFDVSDVPCVVWQSTESFSYELQVSHDMFQSFTVVTNGIIATGSTHEYFDGENRGSVCYYRVRKE